MHRHQEVHAQEQSLGHARPVRELRVNLQLSFVVWHQSQVRVGEDDDHGGQEESQSDVVVVVYVVQLRDCELLFVAGVKHQGLEVDLASHENTSQFLAAKGAGYQHNEEAYDLRARLAYLATFRVPDVLSSVLEVEDDDGHHDHEVNVGVVEEQPQDGECSPQRPESPLAIVAVVLVQQVETGQSGELRHYLLQEK